jgi:hypothetical protein
MEKPWFELDPNDFTSMWWKKTEIIDKESAEIQKNVYDVICYFIIQDSNDMGHLIWRFSTWFKNDINRYSNNVFEWDFNKNLEEMISGEIVYLIKNPYIKFKVNNCNFVKDEYQQKYCKILERID